MQSPNFYYAAFFVTGIATVGTGALVALHGASMPLTDGEIGRLVVSQFAGQLIGSYFVGRQVAARLILGAGTTALLMTVLATIGHLSQPLLFVMGLGLGLTMASINTLAGLESPPAERTRRLEILNVFWPLGAAFCPWLLTRLPEQHVFRSFFIALALLFLIVCVGSALRRTPDSTDTEEAPLAGSSFPLLLSLIALLVVGVESGLANWLPTFQIRYLSASPLPLPLATLFWGSILASRIIASRLLRGRAEAFVLTICALVAGVAAFGLILCNAPWLLTLAVVCAAVALGPIYPLLLTHAIRLRGRGLVFFSASSGSALFPWLIGSAAASYPLRNALLIPAMGSVLLFLLSFVKFSAVIPDRGVR